jgi:hypothetical protein
MKCSRCENEGAKPVPRWVRLSAATALGFVHAGLWANEELRKPLCARCRRGVAAVALAVATVGLTAAGLGAALWLRGAR